MRGLWGRTCLLFVTSGEPRGFRPFLLLLLPLDPAAHLARSELKGIGVALSRTWIPKAESVYSEAPVYLSARSALPPQIWNAFRFQGPRLLSCGRPASFQVLRIRARRFARKSQAAPPHGCFCEGVKFTISHPQIIDLHPCVSPLSVEGGIYTFQGCPQRP